MKTSTTALNRARGLAGRKFQQAIINDPYQPCLLLAPARPRSFTASARTTQHLPSTFRTRHREVTRKEQKTANRDFLISVLDSSATKRDAKAYLQNFNHNISPNVKPPSTSITKSSTVKQSNDDSSDHAVGSTLAMQTAPRFIQHPEMGNITPDMIAPLHVALVKIRYPQSLSDEVLSGIGKTLAQLAKLGLISTIVVDCEDGTFESHTTPMHEWMALAVHQVDRVVAAIDSHGGLGARKTDTVLDIMEEEGSSETSATTHNSVRIVNKKTLMTPLRAGIMPVIPSFGRTQTSNKLILTDANDVVLALLRELAHFQPPTFPDADPKLVEDTLAALRREVSCERLIIIDPLGGIPQADPDRPNRHHVFLNMDQEYDSVRYDLAAPPTQPDLPEAHIAPPITDLANSNPFTRFVEMDIGGAQPKSERVHAPEVGNKIANTNQVHLHNLELTRKALDLLPSRSSVLLTTPIEASISGNVADTPYDSVQEVATRRRRNPLIHNLLTDKPVFSSSLPSHRLRAGGSSSNRTNPTTLAKKGMQISMFPDPRLEPWRPPGTYGDSAFSLKDSRIDFEKLVHLINDSFGRKLDVEAYLNRIRNRVAGVIIAGDYEGGALLTWELPPGVPDDGSAESRARFVPYLDKFAVLRRSQGAGGVADIVFTAMVRTAFPNGVCWRSRKDNPVNKWYFERSIGTWKIADTNWTMFWTTPGLQEKANHGLFLDYEAVCRSIQPTWADKKNVAE